MKGSLLTILLLLSFLTVITAQNTWGLKIGDKVPGFKSTTDEGTVWNVKDYVGKKYIVIYFYPAAMTGGCTKQACAYRDFKTDIESADA